MSNYDFVENGFLMLKDEKISSPIGCVYYEEYENLISLQMKLENKKPDIQCIVTNEAIPNKISLDRRKIQLYGIMQMTLTQLNS